MSSAGFFYVKNSLADTINKARLKLYIIGIIVYKNNTQ